MNLHIPRLSWKVVVCFSFANRTNSVCYLTKGIGTDTKINIKTNYLDTPISGKGIMGLKPWEV